MEIKTIIFMLLALIVFATIIFSKQLRLKKATPPLQPSPKSYPLPPGPRSYPVLGSFLEMLKNKPTFRWIEKLMHDMNTEIACIRLGHTHVIPVNSPELAREFLKKQDVDFASRPDFMSSRLASSGFLTISFSPMGDQWRKMRRVLVSEVLSPVMHEWLGEKRHEEGDHLVRYVYNQCKSPIKNGIVNVRDLTRHYCGNVIRKMVFGKRFFGPGMEDGGPGFEEQQHVDALFTILSRIFGFAIADYVPWLEVLDLDGCKKVMTDAIKKVRKYQDCEITKRVEMWERGERDTKEDILDVLIDLKNSENKPMLSIQEITAEVLEIMIAAIDNPSNAVEWAIAEMMNQPDILDKAREELDRVVGKERLVQESDLSRLNYLKSCIKEMFRMHPLAPFNVPHVSTKDTVVGGYFIPKGSHVLLGRRGLGRNPRVWKDPLKYRPERHIRDQESKVVLEDPNLHILSFSTGRRGCPGIVLGSTMTTILLARLIHAFSWEPPLDTTRISLDESKRDLTLATPVIAHARPRLESGVYLELLRN
ncbi:hypothetical protein ACS0TY_023014 [Phlomoides rotata]